MMKNWIRSLMLMGCVSAVALAPFSEADAALNAYLKLKGQKQGDIKGSVVQKGREGRIGLIAVSHEIISPRDAASGLPTGKRSHKPFVITKEVDKSTPLLANALVHNENLTVAEFSFFQPTGKGMEALAYTVKLTNANISSIQFRTDADGRLLQDVAFTYQKIEWTWHDGGITAADDWQAAGK